MKKTYKYTILTLLLALLFVFGSMIGMNFILRIKEGQLLSESGKAIVEAPVRAWQKEENGEESGKEKEENMQTADTGGYTLTTGQIEEVLERYQKSSIEVAHSPVAGQISMEEAIEAGKEWLTDMGIEMGVEIEEQGNDKEVFSVSARLVSPIQEDYPSVPLEPYYSRWFVRISDNSKAASLYINAVTGQVWNADIIFYEELSEEISDEISDEKLRRFVELCGLQASGSSVVSTTGNQDRTLLYLKLKDSNLSARMEVSYAPEQFIYNTLAEPVYDICDESGGGGVVDYEETPLYKYKEYKENVIMSFQLILQL